MAWFAHRLPAEVHRIEVGLTFVEQLVLPWLVLLPSRAARIAAGCGEFFFQAAIIATGNYAWINWVGALPYIALLD
eukprot:SAG11_NODE_12594_length_695_cov_1.100671_1_plen_75_part_10